VTDLHLGLIGDNIAASKAPRLHILAGQQNGIVVQYDRLVPAELDLGFDDVFARCAQSGYRGVNVTYPYKERAAGLVTIPDPLIREVGAVNTVLFEDTGPRGFNTDLTGFVSAYRSVMATQDPGVICLAGTGGVGRAVAFGLLYLGVSEMRLFDCDAGKAGTLADALGRANPDVSVRVCDTIEAAAQGADGLVNCTPLGMVGYDGSAIPAHLMKGAGWAFDAVYTPVSTLFLQNAAAGGLRLISGYELFVYQGLHAWKLFADLPLDEATLRDSLNQPEKAISAPE